MHGIWHLPQRWSQQWLVSYGPVATTTQKCHFNSISADSAPSAVSPAVWLCISGLSSPMLSRFRTICPETLFQLLLPLSANTRAMRTEADWDRKVQPGAENREGRITSHTHSQHRLDLHSAHSLPSDIQQKKLGQLPSSWLQRRISSFNTETANIWSQNQPAGVES